MDYDTAKPYRMICGSAEVEERTWYIIKGKSGGNWLIPVNDPEPAAHVHYHHPNDKNSEGYAGRTLPFKLEDGSVYQAQGPWHSNSDALFRDTGVDIRDQHLTFVVLAKDRDGSVMKDVLYIDDKPTLGKFERYKELATQYPDARYYYSESHGGSSMGPINQ